MRICARTIRTGSYLFPARVAGRRQIQSTAPRSHASGARRILQREKPLPSNSSETFQPHCSGFKEVKAEKVGPCLSQAFKPMHSSRSDDHILFPQEFDCKRSAARFFQRQLCCPQPDLAVANCCENVTSIKCLNRLLRAFAASRRCESEQ